MANVRNLYNAQVFGPNNSFFGVVKEVALPEIKAKTSVHSGLGAVGDSSFNTGFEILEGSITWSSIYPDAIAEFLDMGAVIPLMIRGNQDIYSGSALDGQVPVVVHLRVMTTTFQLGTLTAHEMTEHQMSFTANYLKLEVDGVEQIAYDAQANVYRVQGVDKLARFRANIGL